MIRLPKSVGKLLLASGFEDEIRVLWETARSSYKLTSDMTAILAWFEKDDLCLAADGLVSNKTGIHPYEYEWKTLRINQYAAIGVAAPCAWHVWHIYALLFGLEGHIEDYMGSAEWLHIVKAIEKRELMRSNLGLDEICAYVSEAPKMINEQAKKWYRLWKDDVPAFRAVVVLATSFNNKLRLYGWNGLKSNARWEKDRICEESPAVVSPGSEEVLEVARQILSMDSLSPEYKIKVCLRFLAEETDKVNGNGTLRRASRGFELEVLYDEHL